MYNKGQRIRCINTEGLSAMEYPPELGGVYRFLEMAANGKTIRITSLVGGVMVGQFSESRFQDAAIPWKAGDAAPVAPKKPAKRTVEAPAPHFDGHPYSPDKDHGRLTSQLLSVRGLMSDGKPHTLREISDATGHPEGSVSARLRDLRKAKFGGHSVTRTRSDDGDGTYLYKLTLNSDATADA